MNNIETQEIASIITNVQQGIDEHKNMQQKVENYLKEKGLQNSYAQFVKERTKEKELQKISKRKRVAEKKPKIH